MIILSSFVFQDNWKPNVSLIVGNKVDDYKHIDILSATVSSGIRRLFTVVTKDSLYNEVGFYFCD